LKRLNKVLDCARSMLELLEIIVHKHCLLLLVLDSAGLMKSPSQCHGFSVAVALCAPLLPPGARTRMVAAHETLKGAVCPTLPLWRVGDRAAARTAAWQHPLRGAPGVRPCAHAGAAGSILRGRGALPARGAGRRQRCCRPSQACPQQHRATLS